MHDIMQNKRNSLQLSKHLVALLHHRTGLRDHLVNNSLGGLLLLDDSSNLAHQEGTSIVESVIIDVVGQVLHIVLNRDDTLPGELLNLLSAVLLPVLDVRVVADSERTALFHISMAHYKPFPEGHTVKMMVRTLSSKPEVRTASW